MNVRLLGRFVDQARITRAVALAECVASGGERHGLLMVHRHALEGHLDIVRGLHGVGIAAAPFRVDVDEAHLDRGERAFEIELFLGQDARLVLRVPDHVLFRAPIDVALGLEHVGAAAAEAEHRATHVLDGDVAGQDEQIGPADVLAVLALDRPQQAACLVEVAIVRPAIERGEALLAAVGSAAPVGGAVGARGMPGHADEERAVMPVIGWPPGLRIGHQRHQIVLERPIIELLE